MLRNIRRVQFVPGRLLGMASSIAWGVILFVSCVVEYSTI